MELQGVLIAWILVAAQTAAILALVFTPLVRKLAVRTGALDHPGPRKIHAEPTPLLGGVAVWIGCFASLGLVLVLGQAELPPDLGLQLLGFFGAATLLLIVGVLDDTGRLHSQIKLFVAMPLAAAITILTGTRLYVFSTLFAGAGLASSWLPVADIALTVVWIVGVSAALNLLDGMDGLCAGIGAIAALGFLAFAVANGQQIVAILAASVFGSCAGFLAWNSYPARIFLGDGGAILIGFMLAVLGVIVQIGDSASSSAVLAPIFILGVPIFDTTLVTVSRLRRGLMPFSNPGRDHIMHRISRRGLPDRTVVSRLHATALCLVLAAAVAARLPLAAVPWLIAGGCVAVAGLIWKVESTDSRHRGSSPGVSGGTGLS